MRKGVGPTSGLIISADGYVISSAFNFANKPSAIIVVNATVYVPVFGNVWEIVGLVVFTVVCWGLCPGATSGCPDDKAGSDLSRQRPFRWVGSD